MMIGSGMKRFFEKCAFFGIISLTLVLLVAAPARAELRFRGAWSASISYAVDDVVQLGASSYRAKLVNLNAKPDFAVNATRWERIVSGMAHRGAWAAATAYNVGDVVSHLGSSYAAIGTSLNVGRTPNINLNTWWRLIASAGAVGPAGPAGPAGPVNDAPLDCYTTADIERNLGNNFFTFSEGPACDAGYSVVSPKCNVGSGKITSSGVSFDSNKGLCGYENDSGFAITTLTASNCCRFSAAP
jgi:hypothetical protein